MIRNGYGGYLVSVWLDSFKRTTFTWCWNCIVFVQFWNFFESLPFIIFRKEVYAASSAEGEWTEGGRCWCKINLASFLFHWGRLRQFFFFFKSNLYMTVISSVRQKTAITFFAQKGWIKLFWGTLIRIRCFSSETLHLSLKLWACNLIFKLQLFFLSSDYKLWLINTISNSQALCKLIYSDYPFLTSFPFKIRIIRVNPVSWLK